MNEHILICRQSGVRLDRFLADSGLELSRSAAVGLIDNGNVTVNGKAQNKKYKLSDGDEVIICIPDPVPYEAKAENIPLDIIYEDGDLLVVNKPKGMVVHPAAGNEDGTLVNALLYHVRDLSGIGGEMRPGIVHRLDKDTSGLILIAKNDHAHTVMSEQFKERSTEKHYRAVAYGNFQQDEGLIDAPIARHPVDRKKMAVVPGGKPSKTQWTVMERLKGATYLDVHLLTGRTHQIRVHMQSIGHPLLGDCIYAPHTKVAVHIPRLMLHAYSLAFDHPTTGERMEFVAPLPEKFSVTLEKLRS